MDESILDDDLPIARKSLIPGAGFFVESEPVSQAEGTITDASVVVVADPDADGLTATALIEVHHGEVTLVPTEPRTLHQTIETLAAEIDEPEAVYFLDLCPDSVEEVADDLAHIRGQAEYVGWYDHHQWEDEVADTVRLLGIDLVVGPSDRVCTADVTFSELNGDFDDRWEDLVDVVRDHDLWIREDPRSDDIADFSYWSEAREFIETITAHGADLPDSTMAMLQERREEKQALVEIAIERAEYRDLDGITVGITYGRCSQNEVAEGLRQHGADAAVVIKPSGGISLRGTETFQRCHAVARRLGGGGHPKAAGCKPDIFDDILDYAYHWTTQGAVARRVVIDAFAQVRGQE